VLARQARGRRAGGADSRRACGGMPRLRRHAAASKGQLALDERPSLPRQ